MLPGRLCPRILADWVFEFDTPDVNVPILAPTCSSSWWTWLNTKLWIHISAPLKLREVQEPLEGSPPTPLHPRAFVNNTAWKPRRLGPAH